MYKKDKIEFCAVVFKSLPQKKNHFWKLGRVFYSLLRKPSLFFTNFGLIFFLALKIFGGPRFQFFSVFSMDFAGGSFFFFSFPRFFLFFNGLFLRKYGGGGGACPKIPKG